MARRSPAQPGWGPPAVPQARAGRARAVQVALAGARERAGWAAQVAERDTPVEVESRASNARPTNRSWS